MYAEIVRGVEMGSLPLLEEHTVKRVVSSAPLLDAEGVSGVGELDRRK